MLSVGVDLFRGIVWSHQQPSKLPSRDPPPLMNPEVKGKSKSGLGNGGVQSLWVGWLVGWLGRVVVVEALLLFLLSDGLFLLLSLFLL